MEDVMQFLLVAGILAFGIYKQFNKEKSKKPEKSMPMPTPEYEYEPEFEKPVIFEKPQKKTVPPPKPSLPQEGIRNTHAPNNISEPIKEADRSEFSIQSAEEARRAIIWSEILQRKY